MTVRVSSFSQYLSNSELANQQIQSETVNIEEEKRNKVVVIELYNALNKREVETVQQLLTAELEWWFHGPPDHQHMMSLLTGTSPDDSFVFIPRSICVFGCVVVVEGTDLAASSYSYWIHVWTVGSNGVIMQVREYFNTSLTVTKLGDGTKASSLVWRTQLPDQIQAQKSLPGLLLAI